MSSIQDNVNIYRAVKNIDLSDHAVRFVVSAVVNRLKKKPTVSIHFIGDQRMRRLNREYRSKDKTTDVLSFSMLDEEDWGDIFLSIPQIRRQARSYGRPYREELMRMLIHGILHLAGYDHEKASDYKIMLPLQESLVIGVIGSRKKEMRNGL